MSKVVDVACIGVDEALLVRRDLVRAEVVGRHRESVVEMGRRRRARTRATQSFNGKEVFIHKSANGLKCTNPSPIRPIQAPNSGADRVY